VQEEGGQARFSDEPFADDPGEVGLGGGEAEFGAEEVHDSGFVGCGQHLGGVGGVEGEGFLAQHVPSGFDRPQDQGQVGLGRGRDADGVQAGQGEGLVQGGEGVRDTEETGPCGGLGRVAADEGQDLESGGTEGRDMGKAAEPGADDRDSSHGFNLALASQWSPAGPDGKIRLQADVGGRRGSP
jgi:hypothetical protein